jgi:hypothetical protein
LRCSDVTEPATANGKAIRSKKKVAPEQAAGRRSK